MSEKKMEFPGMGGSIRVAEAHSTKSGWLAPKTMIITHGSLSKPLYMTVDLWWFILRTMQENPDLENLVAPKE